MSRSTLLWLVRWQRLFHVQYGTIYVDLDFQIKPISTSIRTQNLYLSIAHLMSVHLFVVSE